MDLDLKSKYDVKYFHRYFYKQNEPSILLSYMTIAYKINYRTGQLRFGVDIRPTPEYEPGKIIALNDYYKNPVIVDFGMPCEDYCSFLTVMYLEAFILLWFYNHYYRKDKNGTLRNMINKNLKQSHTFDRTSLNRMIFSGADDESEFLCLVDSYDDLVRDNENFHKVVDDVTENMNESGDDVNENDENTENGNNDDETNDTAQMCNDLCCILSIIGLVYILYKIGFIVISAIISNMTIITAIIDTVIKLLYIIVIHLYEIAHRCSETKFP